MPCSFFPSVLTPSEELRVRAVDFLDLLFDEIYLIFHHVRIQGKMPLRPDRVDGQGGHSGAYPLVGAFHIPRYSYELLHFLAATLLMFIYCPSHCDTCKILGGGAFSLNQIIPQENLKITKGEVKSYDYTGDSGR